MYLDVKVHHVFTCLAEEEMQQLGWVDADQNQMMQQLNIDD